MLTLKPRLVHLVKQPGVVSFGFNVTATRSEPHRYVGIVVDNSLAKQGGLRSGDRVHEVNGQGVDGIPLPEVQGMVAKGGTEVQLLVADPMTDQLYKDNNEVIRGGLPETIYIKAGGNDDVHGLTNGDVEIEAEVVEADDFMNHDDRMDTENHMGTVLIQAPVQPYKARLCTVKKWPDYKGYGFVLNGDKEVPGQNIGKIEPGSPAEAAGLREDDKLIEVNGVNVEREFQSQVVQKIAAGPVPNRTTLLAVDEEAYNYFRDHDILVHSSMVDVEHLETPERTVMVEESKPVMITQNGDAGGRFRARLCTVKKWPDYQGYGFIMHGDKDDPGQNIGKVDPNSPAEAAGVRPGDRLIEVNGENVENAFQDQVVAKIAAGPIPNETTLLVVDPDTLRFFRGHGMPVNSSMSEMDRIETPARHLVPAQSSDIRVRLCHIKQWHDFNGFGFVLHGEKGIPGTIVTNIDQGSPAEAAGLMNGDIIIEVNGINIESEEQPQAIARVQMGVDGDTTQTRLLVVDAATDRYYKGQNIPISGSMEDVVYLSNPDRDILPPPPPVIMDPVPIADSYPDSMSESPPPSNRSSTGIRARLCHLKKWTTFDGYGFYLASNEDGQGGVCVGKIDPDSPAEAAGLRVHDRIIEVNGINVESDTQTELVEKVILVPHETRLLVVDKLAYSYFLKMGVLVNGNMTDVDIIEAPEK